MHTASWKHTARKATVRLACIATLIATANPVWGQTAPTAGTDKAPEPTQAVQRDYRFEVASIRPTDPPGGRYQGSWAPPYTPGHYRLEKTSLGGMVGTALNIKQSYHIKCPEWMNSDWFSLNATLPEGATKADLPVMMLHLLEDRFALKYHQETRHVDGYELVAAKSGAKLAKSEGPPPDPPAGGGPPRFEIKDGVPQFAKDSKSQQMYRGSANGSIAWWHGRDESMQRLASDLSGRLRVPVIDATGLDGKYDFSLNFIEENSSISAGSNGAATPSEYSPLPNALEQQLGLKLRPIKNVPVDVVVIDSANKQPTDN